MLKLHSFATSRLQTNMHLQLIFISSLAVIMLTSACAPPANPAEPENGGGERKRRSVATVDDSAFLSITIVTNQAFNAETNTANMNRVRDLIEAFEVHHNITYDVDRLQHEARSIGGKLAVHYQMNESCQKVTNFVSQIRQVYTEMIAYGLIHCPGHALTVV